MEDHATQDILQEEYHVRLQEFAPKEDALMETISVSGLNQP